MNLRLEARSTRLKGSRLEGSEIRNTCTGLTNRQQYALQQRIVTARKAKEMRTIAEGRGCKIISGIIFN